MANSTSCPMELEPRTLNQLQLTQAREVAAEVVQKLEPCEASALFIEGLMHPIEEEKQLVIVDCMKKAESIPDDVDKVNCHCQCSCSTAHQYPFKEPLSAPF